MFHKIPKLLIPEFAKIHWRYLGLAAIFICSALTNFTFSPPAYAKSCDDVQFIFARGSGEQLNDTSFSSWKSEITKLLAGSTLRYSFYELGSSSQAGYQYPAVAVSGDLQGVTNLLGAYISAGQAYEFGQSVMQGEIELNVYTRRINSGCSQTKFILGGYSQGAMLLTQALDDLESEQIIYVTTFGDPKLYLPEGKGSSGRFGKVPDACKGKNFSPYRIDVADCYAYEGILGSVRPYQPANYTGKIGTWCNSYDIMCSSGMNINDHTSYVSENLYQDAAYKIYQKLRQNFPDNFAPKQTLKDVLHDVVFLFDVTGSMQSGLARYKTEAKKLAQSVVEQGGRISLFTYGDVQDGVYPTELCASSCTLADFANHLDSIKVYGGGDSPESLLSAIMTALNHTSWRRSAAKSLIVLTDDAYHDPDFDKSKTTLADVVRRSLEIDPVNVYVLTTNKATKYYAELTNLTGGKVFDYNQDTSLQLSTLQITERPVAKLSLENYVGLVGEEITFDASSSYSLDDATLYYDWDLDGDNIFEIENSAATIHQVYPQQFSDYIQVRVRDDSDRLSTMSAKVSIHQEAPVSAEIINASFTKTSTTSATINFQTNADQVLILVNDLPVGFVVPSSTRGNFTLEEISEDTTITLVPYLQQLRGNSYTLNIATDVRPATPSTQPKAPAISTFPAAPETGSFIY